MKKIFAAIILLFTTAIIAGEFFEINQKIHCNDTSIVFDNIKNEFNEEPIWIGSLGNDGKAILFVNMNKGTWTYVLSATDKACVVNVGDGFSYKTMGKSATTI